MNSKEIAKVNAFYKKADRAASIKDNDEQVTRKREIAITYIRDNAHVMQSFRFHYDSMTDENLERLVRLIKSLIRDFPNDYQELNAY